MVGSRLRDEDQQLGLPFATACTPYAAPRFLPFTDQSSWPAFDQVAVSTSIGRSTSPSSPFSTLLQLVVV
jgi:hypothetical protein